MDPQSRSPLFCLPTELRWAIYSHTIPVPTHIFLRCGKIAVAACCEPSQARNLFGRERKNTGDLVGDYVWMRRLRSSWGPHWKCEEAARAKDYGSTDQTPVSVHNDTLAAVITVCRAMQLDVLQWIATSTTVNITDLETLECLIARSQGADISPQPSNILHTVWASIRNLNITLRLPFEFYQSLESHLVAGGSRDPDNAQLLEDVEMMTTGSADAASLVERWMRIWPDLDIQAGQLRKLNIWLDHDNLPSWSFINERAVVSHMTMSMLASLPSALELITIDLPNLHPPYETPERHYITGSIQPLPPIVIHRRLRQRYFSEQISGNWELRYLADFPLLYDVDEEEGETLEDVEREERRIWESKFDRRRVLTGDLNRAGREGRPMTAA